MITNMNTSIIEQKKLVRQEMAARREAAQPEAWARWSAELVSQLQHLLEPGRLLDQKSLPLNSRRPVIALYRAMRQEADLSAAQVLLTEKGWQLAYPRMVHAGEQLNLQFLALPDRTRSTPPAQDAQASPPTASQLSLEQFFIPGPFGLSEPDPAQTLICEPDVILLPGLAFDRYGNRLGWGKGYYDNFLAKRFAESHDTLQAMPLLIGIALPFQLIPEVPHTDHDWPLDAILTPDGLLQVRT